VLHRPLLLLGVVGAPGLLPGPLLHGFPVKWADRRALGGGAQADAVQRVMGGGSGGGQAGQGGAQVVVVVVLVGPGAGQLL
jgi:hypothetical protein